MNVAGPLAILGGGTWGTLVREHNAFMPRGKLDPTSVKVRVTCAACGRDYLATPQPDGSWLHPGGAFCDCGTALTPRFTTRQLDQMHRLREENPNAKY